MSEEPSLKIKDEFEDKLLMALLGGELLDHNLAVLEVLDKHAHFGGQLGLVEIVSGEG